MTPEELFWTHVDKSGGPDACWIWTGARQTNGYGLTTTWRNRKPAHRFSWELANGRAIPDGLIVCHTCDVPLCVNPAHLWLGTHAANNADKIHKGRHHYLNRTTCKRGHEWNAEHTAYHLINGKRYRYCRTCRHITLAAWLAKKRAAEREAS